ncbi:MAG: hypothetical protein ACSLE0_23425 [Chitinophagaceae bacterium]
MNDLILDNWDKLLVPATAIITWVFVKRRYQNRELAKSDADLTGANLGNVTANFEVYQNLITDLETRFKNRIGELESDLDRMKALNEELRAAVQRQERYINKLLIKLDKYETPGE